MGKVICLIEDRIIHKNAILSLLEEKTPQDLKNEISFVWLPSEEKEKKGHQYYTEDILQDIERKKDELETNGNSMGILLDLILTEEEDRILGQTFYPKVGLGKEIYFKYRDNMPIYIITDLNTFGAQCDVIMGEDLSDRYVTKSALIKYKMRNSIDNLFEFYKKGFNIIG